jgi:hypothetical protein
VPHAIRPNDERPRNAPWDEPRRSGLRSTAITNDAESSPLVGKRIARLSPDPLSTCQPIRCRTEASGTRQDLGQRWCAIVTANDESPAVPGDPGRVYLQANRSNG